MAFEHPRLGGNRWIVKINDMTVEYIIDPRDLSLRFTIGMMDIRRPAVREPYPFLTILYEIARTR
jgi:hypothetical protein